jgi:hypothetical protein
LEEGDLEGEVEKVYWLKNVLLCVPSDRCKCKCWIECSSVDVDLALVWWNQ